MSESLLVRARRLKKHLDERFIYDIFSIVNALVILFEVTAMSKLIASFNAYYEQRPLLTMMISNSILNGVADTAAQTVTAIRQRAVRKPFGPDPATDPLAIEIHKIDTKLPDILTPQEGGSSRSSSSSSRIMSELGEPERGGGRGGLIPQSRNLPPPFDFERLARFMVWGFAMAPLQFTWFKVLSKTFPITPKNKEAAFSQTLKRVGCDQLMFAPVGLAMFFTFMTLAEGKGRKEVGQKFDKVYMPALRGNYMLWPAVQIVNFRWMPIQFQLPFVSTVGIFWTTYLSLTNSAADA